MQSRWRQAAPWLAAPVVGLPTQSQPLAGPKSPRRPTLGEGRRADHREMNPLLQAVDAVDAHAQAVAEAKAGGARAAGAGAGGGGAAPGGGVAGAKAGGARPAAAASGSEGACGFAVVVVGGRVERLERHEAFDEKLHQLHPEAPLVEADEQPVELVAQMLLHEVEFFQVDEFALGVVGATLRLRRLDADGAQLVFLYI